MESVSPDSERPSRDEAPKADEGRKHPDQTEARSNASNQCRRPNGGPLKRTSWNRSLSIRGRESIIFAGGVAKGRQRGGRRKLKQKKVHEKLFDFSKEKEYFEEVDAFELLEESPTPNKFSWKISRDYEFPEHDLASILGRWRRSKLFSERCTAWPLSKIMETVPFPSAHGTSIGSFNCGIACSLSQIREATALEMGESGSNGSVKKPVDEAAQSEVASNFASEERGIFSENVSKNLIGDFSAGSVLSTFSALRIRDKFAVSDESEGAFVLSESSEGTVGEFGGSKDIDALSPESFEGESQSAFEQLLMVCRQEAPVNLSEIVMKYCDSSSIKKLGEGTYGEAFRVGATACKIVPIDGNMLINGEIQKKSEEVLEEVLLSLTLNSLREQHDYSESLNSCSNFIESKDFRVCQGLYDKNLIRAWEEWDADNNSENDHPCNFPKDQLYIVFVLADGGKDLENFLLLNFNEARSLLVQVMAALAVAEVSCEFEHRDLHWGNILLRRNEDKLVHFILEGKKMSVNAFGMTVSIIDFTLSRVNTGEAVLFLNLSVDPELFKGPKGNVQFETYRRMKEVTGECWEKSFPKTNVLWLMYLAEILDKKKIYERTTKDERNLRSFKRRLNNYESAKDSLSDPFFTEFLVDV